MRHLYRTQLVAIFYTLILLFSGSKAAMAASYYVDNVKGNDAASGDDRSPWQSLSHAASRLTAGDSLIVIPNGPTQPYRDKIRVRTSGEHDAVITITGSANIERPIITGARDFSDRLAGGSMQWNTANQDGMLSLHNAAEPVMLLVGSQQSWKASGLDALVRRERAPAPALLPGQWHYSADQRILNYRPLLQESIQNLHIEAVLPDTLLRIQGQSHLTIGDLQFRYAAHTAILLSGGVSHIMLDNVAVEHAGKNAISVRSGNNIIIQDCFINDATNNGIVFGGSKNPPLRDSAIRGCRISGVTKNDCITLHQDSAGNDIGSGFRIENNLLTDCGEQGIDVTSGRDITLSGNTTYGNGVSGIVLGHGVENVQVNNHLSVDDGSYAGLIVNRSKDISLVNNCILSSAKHQLVFNDTQNVRVKGNAIYQGKSNRGSVIDIAGQSSGLLFSDNISISESSNNSLLLRYLQHNDPTASKVTYDSNMWSAPLISGNFFYTASKGKHSLGRHKKAHQPESNDQFTAGLVFSDILNIIVQNQCDLDLVPLLHHNWLPAGE
jgi:parallel beta-helix repeat protein